MSILKIYEGGEFKDFCSLDLRLYKNGFFYKVKNGDKIYVNGQWKTLACTFDFKWIIDESGSSCEKTYAIVNVPFTLASPMQESESLRTDIEKAPASNPYMKKNVITGKYIFDLYWIHKSSLGVGPNTYQEAFANGLPVNNIYNIYPIGRIDDPLLYPTTEFHLYGVGCFGKQLAGKIDTSGYIWMTSAEQKSITAWNPFNPIYIMHSYNLDAANDFGSFNPLVNSGYVINTKRKKVTNDLNEYALDVNNQLVSESGLPQDTQTIDSSEPDYRILNTTTCPLDSISYGNAAITGDFTRDNCEGGFTGSTVPYTLPANTVFAATQIEADAQANVLFNENGQENANTYGTCTQTTFWNVEKKGTFTKNDCTVPGESGTEVLFVVEANTISAPTQAEADAAAQLKVDTEGQAYANQNGECIGTSYPFKWVADETTAYCETQDIVINEFDFLVARFMWDFPSAGKDLDIQVQFEDNNEPSVDGIYVGYGGVSPTLPAAVLPETNTYLWWGLDDTNASTNPLGIEGVLIGMKKFKDDFPNSNEIIKVGLYAVWFSSVLTGNFTLEIATYKGGTMSKVGTNIVNTDGEQVSLDLRYLTTTVNNQAHTPASSFKVGVLEYNKTTDTAVLILS